MTSTKCSTTGASVANDVSDSASLTQPADPHRGRPVLVFESILFHMELTIQPPATWWELAIRLVVALLLGAVVGWDRERRHRPAGFRTHMAVALGSCGFTVLGLLPVVDASGAPLPLDPLRVMAGVIGGVGFLGAGAIIQSGGQVHGLTTAAGLWVIAAVGMAAGAGAFLVAAILSVLTFATLVFASGISENIEKDGDAELPEDD